jgi:hypothetical protein
MSAATNKVLVGSPSAVNVGDYCMADQECLLITAKSGRELTFSRAQLGTSAAAHEDGTTLRALTVEDILPAVVSASEGSSGRISSVGTQTISAAGSSVIDSSLYDTFDITANGDFTLDAPTNGEDGYKVLVRVLNNTGSAVTITAGADLSFGDDPTALADVAAGATDLIGLVYRESDETWLVVGQVTGF